jgi:hypothetical protein
VPIETGPKKLVIPSATQLPSEDAYDTLLVIKKAQSERESAKNFLSSAFSLVQ